MSDELKSIPLVVAEKLRHYVYLYIDPRNERVFYVGKGQGSRALEHLGGAANPAVRQTIKQVHRAGLEVRIDILRHGLGPREALETEAAAIDAYGLGALENRVRGHLGDSSGRVRLSDLVRYLEPREIKPREGCMLIRINKTYRPGMSPLDLYEATRGIWRIKVKRAKKVRYALAVYDSSVLEAYELARDKAGDACWFRAGTTAYFTRFQSTGRGLGARSRLSRMTNRYEFVGRVVEGSLRRVLIGRLPKGTFSKGSQNPIQYWGP
jgi:hypothetical protein